MKRILLLSLFSLYVCLAFAQSINTQTKETEIAVAYASLDNSKASLSPRTAILLLQLKYDKSKSRASILQDYTLVEKNKIQYIQAFLLAETNKDFSQLGFLQNSKIGNIRTGLIDLEKIEELASHPEVKYIELSQKAFLTLDNANAQVRADLVHQGFNLTQAYTGAGVVVGVIDLGFDYTHPTFFDSTGTNYRIKRVWETGNQTGTPPAGYFYGTELIGDSVIQAAETDNNTSSHGTHVTGIAAGSGARTGGKYHGVAFNSDLVLVAIGGSGAVILDGIQYIMDYAESVNKPCVINLSIGSHTGPHDGTSLFDQACDALVDTGKILVGAAGNNGQDSLYLEKTFTGNDTLLYTFLKDSYSVPNNRLYANVDVWGEPGDTFQVAVHIYNTQTNSTISKTPYFQVPGPHSNSLSLSDKDSISPDIYNVNISPEISPLNNKPHVFLSIVNTTQNDDFKWVMLEIKGKNTQTKMWTWGSFTDKGYPPPVMPGSTNSTMGEIGGTGKSVLSVGAYTSRNNFQSLSNGPQSISPMRSVGDIGLFSSKGPTADNRTKPDVTAPGNVVVAPVSSFDPYFVFSNPNVVFGMGTPVKNYYYAASSGTSMASPMVAGVVALWLEADPSLTYDRILKLIKNTSIIDTYTGAIPLSGDNTWGWGKIDAYNGLLNVVGIDEPKLAQNLISIYPNPSQGEVFLHSKDAESIEMQIYDLQGRTVLPGTKLPPGITKLNLNHLENGIYFLQYEKKGAFYTKKIMLTK